MPLHTVFTQLDAKPRKRDSANYSGWREPRGRNASHVRVARASWWFPMSNTSGWWQKRVSQRAWCNSFGNRRERELTYIWSAIRTLAEKSHYDRVFAATPFWISPSVSTLRNRVASSQSKRKARIEAWLGVDLPARFAGRILPIDTAIVDRWVPSQRRPGEKERFCQSSTACSAPLHWSTIWLSSLGMLSTLPMVRFSIRGTL